MRSFESAHKYETMARKKQIALNSIDNAKMSRKKKQITNHGNLKWRNRTKTQKTNNKKIDQNEHKVFG